MADSRKVALVDYGMGNLHSVGKALELVGADVSVTANPIEISSAERIVLPGVGAFGQAMARLEEKGLIDALRQEVLIKRKPFLGICLGMQLVAKDSDEWGRHAGLGWIDGQVRRFDVETVGLKVPHVGWNGVHQADFPDGRKDGSARTEKRKHPLFDGVPDDSDFYFVHSFAMRCRPENVAATTDYGGPFVSAVHQDNIFATQFHPEKSQENGLKILENFTKWTP